MNPEFPVLCCIRQGTRVWCTDPVSFLVIISVSQILKKAGTQCTSQHIPEWFTQWLSWNILNQMWAVKTADSSQQILHSRNSLRWQPGCVCLKPRNWFFSITFDQDWFIALQMQELQEMTSCREECALKIILQILFLQHCNILLKCTLENIYASSAWPAS